ncbi:hypothetical protein FLM52_14695 [bacterium Scap17]|nr:hypothetical protein [bacterium Scap17]
MEPQELSQSSRSVLEKQSEDAIVNALSSLKTAFHNRTLIDSENPFFINQEEAIKEFFSEITDSPKPNNDLTEHMSISVIIHNNDGWSYLTQAMQAIIRGDIGAASHLAYYAELRAALSILASQGIGIYNYRNIIVDSTGKIHKLNKSPTHKITWLALEEWAKSANASDFFGSEILPFNIPLRDWLHEYEGTPDLSHTGASLIKMWGLELSKYSLDRSSRNEVSYQVNLKPELKRLTPHALTSFMSEIWSSSNPESKPFSSLDSKLLKKILHTIYSEKSDAIFTQSSYDTTINRTCSNLETPAYVKSYLISNDSSDESSILDYAYKNRGADDDYQFLDVFSRAFLLLRLASASTSRLMRKADVTLDELAFWWLPMSYSSGIANEGSLTGEADYDFENLWHEINDAIEDLEDVDPENSCVKTFMSDYANTIEPLSRLDKLTFFGLKTM